MSARKASLSALVGATGVRATARGERPGRANWGPSSASGQVPQPDGIIQKPSGSRKRRRGAIVSDDLAGQYNRPRSQGPLDLQSWSEVLDAAWTKVRLRIKRRE